MVSTSLLMVLVATTAAGVAAGGEPPTTAAAFTVSPEAIAQADEASDTAIEDSSRLASARQSANLAASAYVERQRQVAIVRAQAAAAARRKAAERAARDKARKALVAQRQAALAGAQADPRGAARVLMADRGWGSEGEFGCLDSLWTKESGWNYAADNPTSDAYGIPQSLPGSKMASVGADWATNPVTQITWGLNYIASRYGTPCAAWGHSQAMNWY